MVGAREFLLKLKNKAKFLRKKMAYAIVAIFGLYIFSLPSFSGREYFNYISYVLIAGEILLVFANLLLFDDINQLKSYKFIPVTLFVSFSLIGTIIYSHQFRSWLSLLLLLVSSFTFYLAFSTFDSVRPFLYALLIGLFGFCIYFLIVYRNDIANVKEILASGSRLGKYFDNVNEIGSYMSLGVLIGLYLTLFSKNKVEFLSIIAIIAFFFVGLLTGSRSFIVSTILIIIALLFVRIKNKLIFAILMILIIVAFVILINMPFLSFLKQQLQNSFFTLFGFAIGDVKVDHSTVARSSFQRYAFYLGSQNPFIGYGVGGFAIYSTTGSYSHGNFTEVFCNFGLLGLILFYVSIGLPLYDFRKNSSHDKYIIPAVVIFYAINSFLTVYYYDKAFYILISLCYYLCKNNRITNLLKKQDVCVFLQYKELKL